MSWYWHPTGGPADTDARAQLGLDRRFDNQGDAESWLGEFYPDLLDAGVEAVTLFDEDRAVYGPMGLEADTG